jgi:hypothetical protein
MQCLHLDLIIVNLLPDPSELIPDVPPLLLYRPLLIPLFLRILMQYLLQVQYLILLCLGLQHNILL